MAEVREVGLLFIEFFEPLFADNKKNLTRSALILQSARGQKSKELNSPGSFTHYSETNIEAPVVAVVAIGRTTVLWIEDPGAAAQ
jgi:hypothetical protein